MDLPTLLQRIHLLLSVILGGSFAGKTAQVQSMALDLRTWLRAFDLANRTALEGISSKDDLNKHPPLPDLHFLSYEQPRTFYCGKLGVLTPLEMRELLLKNLDNLQLVEQVHAYPKVFGTTVFEDAAEKRSMALEELQKLLKNAAKTDQKV